jgi:protein-S-isoprenylcysteine O-methyltransferase Ste14
MLFFRALLAFLALPFVVGGVLPWLILRNDHSRGSGTLMGWPLLSIGTIVFLWCVRDFYVIGKGTLAPWDPPRNLVTVGLYRFVRNPIYVGVLAFVAGWSLISGSWRLASYVVMLAVGFHLRVLFYEEPTLARLFGNEWEQYRSHVNRWWPKRPSR